MRSYVPFRSYVRVARPKLKRRPVVKRRKPVLLVRPRLKRHPIRKPARPTLRARPKLERQRLRVERTISLLPHPKLKAQLQPERPGTGHVPASTPAAWPASPPGPPAPAQNFLAPHRPAPAMDGAAVDPYVDYARALTPEGGIHVTYKDIDSRLRHTLWRLFAWSVATGLEAWFLFYQSPLHREWLNWACLLAAAILNWLIVRKPVEIYRTIEVRPDCIILDGKDVFWRRFMENGWPSFKQDEKGNLVLSGIYGTRFVEYLTARRFDELDRAPEVFAAHLQTAMQQMWTRPHN